MSPSQALVFVSNLAIAGHRVSIEARSESEFTVHVTVPNGWWYGEGEDLASAIEDLIRFINGSPRKT